MFFVDWSSSSKKAITKILKSEYGRSHCNAGKSTCFCVKTFVVSYTRGKEENIMSP